MLYLFDLDGTLISSYMDNPKREYNQWRVLPNRREKLAILRNQGHHVALVTNQAGVAFGFTSEAVVKKKIAEALTQLGLPIDTPVAVSYAHPKSRIKRYNDPTAITRRKPAPGMLLEMMSQLGYQPEQTVMVGDMEADQGAAQAAGVRFVDAELFFAPE